MDKYDEKAREIYTSSKKAEAALKDIEVQSVKPPEFYDAVKQFHSETRELLLDIAVKKYLNLPL